MAVRSRSPLSSAISMALPNFGLDVERDIKIGLLAPLTGPLKSWAEPGLAGCQIWKDRVNRSGGLKVGNRFHRIELVAFDTQFNPELALRGARKLVSDEGVAFLLMVGGNDITRPFREFINQHRMLVATLLPSDLTPDSPTIVAPSEVHPIYNVTGVDWLSRTQPGLKTAALCAQDDMHGLPSIATYRAAFEAAGIELVAEHLFPVHTTEFGPIVEDLIAANPDILCWDTAYEPFVHALTIEAFKRDYKGRLLSCTCDGYQELVDRTSERFMEGFVFQFPDFDDPKLNDPAINFQNPSEFYEEFCSRYPGMWSAVSWEYASTLDLWKSAVEAARTIEPFAVLSMMKVGGVGRHAFGEASWWGRELFGLDNALVGYWPVVTIQGGKARIVEFTSILNWIDQHGDLLVKHMRGLGLMWDQRERVRLSNASASI